MGTIRGMEGERAATIPSLLLQAADSRLPIFPHSVLFVSGSSVVSTQNVSTAFMIAMNKVFVKLTYFLALMYHHDSAKIRINPAIAIA
jgi:hypothetical protein